MPEIDYVLLADYVRQDAGMTHIMGAGLDTIAVPGEQLPVAVPVGIAARISFSSRDEVGEAHDLSLVFQGPDGDLLTVLHRFPTPASPAGVPVHWQTGVGITLRLMLPITRHGDYTMVVTLDGDPRLSRTLNVRAIGQI